MPIKANTPYTTPAIESKTYEDLWVHSIGILCPTVDSGRVAIELLPYSAARGEIGQGQVSTLITDKLWTAVAEVPTVKSALDAILAAVPDLVAWVSKVQAAEAEAAAAANVAPVIEMPVIEERG